MTYRVPLSYNRFEVMMMKKLKKILIALIIIVVLVAGGCIYYINDYYHATDRENALKDTDKVKVEKIDDGYFFDGPGTDKALIFYPGAKVEDIAYANLLKDIAENGVDCFLIHMPANLAILGKNRADDIMEEYSYDKYYLMGHSMGGAMAVSYAEDNGDKMDGLIFLAAYSAVDLSKYEFGVLSIYGNQDGVLNMEKVESGRKYMPDNYMEQVIHGGNHAQFGDYGNQKGDKDATISPKEQQERTVEYILNFVK